VDVGEKVGERNGQILLADCEFCDICSCAASFNNFI
jgi:hypothetical protein